MNDHDAEIERLAQSRAEADRLYNDALTAVDAAISAPQPELPRPAADYDDRQLQPLNESWRLLPDETIDLGTGWRRRLHGLVWRLIGPTLQRQQRFNGLLVEHFNRNAQVAGENRAAVAAFAAALDRRLEALAGFQQHLVRYLQQITLYVDTRDRHEAGGARRDISHVRDLLDGLGAAINAVTDEFRKRLESAQIHDDRATEELEALRQAVAAAQIRDDRATEELEALRQAVAAAQIRDDRATEELEALRQAVAADRTVAAGLRQSVELVTAATHALKRECERLREAPTVAAGLPAAGRRQEAPSAAPTLPAAAGDLDTYKYVCFEDAFRGPRDEIAAQQREYLAYFAGASDVLDVGCGRGEFLALLREQDITGRGLDTNAEAIERCREQGLDASRDDAVRYLRGLADESLGGLFSAQVVEHLEAEYLMRMLAEAQRALRPGSRIVLETLNPASWTAFFSAFVRDITHRHPLHPDTLSYLLRASGFVDVEIVYRSPVPAAARLQRAAVDATLADTPAGAAVCALAETLNRHVDRLNGLIFAEQDYAAIGRRP